MLTRCDLVENRYRLRDAAGSHAVADYLKTAQPAFGIIPAGNGLIVGQHFLA
jgi:hypothetical protein